MEPLEERQFRSGVLSLKRFLQYNRSSTRQKVKINPPEGYDYEANPKYNLTAEQLEWYYPASKNHSDWTREDDHIGKGREADIEYLEKLLPTVYPELSYFQEEEMPFLMSIDSPLKYPPIHFIRKFYNCVF